MITRSELSFEQDPIPLRLGSWPDPLLLLERVEKISAFRDIVLLLKYHLSVTRLALMGIKLQNRVLRINT